MGDLICYCFNYTAFDIEKDVRMNGKSTILERIMSEKKDGGCQCAVKNPNPPQGGISTFTKFLLKKQEMNF